MAASVESERATPSMASTVLNSAIALLLVLAAVAFLALAQRRYEAWQERYSVSFAIHLELWVLWVGLAALGGLAFGLAAWVPRRPLSYRWGRAVVLGIVPLLLLAHFAFVLGYALPNDWNLPDLLLSFYFNFNLGPQFGLAILVGIAVAAGFAPSRERRFSEGFRETE